MNNCFVGRCGTRALAVATSSGPQYKESKHRADDVEHDSPPFPVPAFDPGRLTQAIRAPEYRR